jgi:hypothetical protein
MSSFIICMLHQGDHMMQDEMGMTCRTHGVDKKYIQMSDKKSEGKRPTGRSYLKFCCNLLQGLVSRVHHQVVQGPV